LQKHPHPTINSCGGREGWVSLGVSIEAGKKLECSSPHAVSYEPACDAPFVYVRTKSYSDTNAEELDTTATETQGAPSKGAEDEETVRMFKIECHQKELDQCSIDMKRLISMNTFKTKTGIYEVSQISMYRRFWSNLPLIKARNPWKKQYNLKTIRASLGRMICPTLDHRVLPFQSHKTFHSSQYTRLQDAPEAVGNFSSHEQVQEKMTCPKEANGNSQDSGYSTAPKDMFKFGQMSPPSQALAISIFTQDARLQDVPDAME
jgi:hypothetical protein